MTHELSKERLALLANPKIECTTFSNQERAAMARALLAGMEQEPEWLYREHNLNNGMKTGWEILTQMQYDILKDTADPETAEFKKVFTHPAPSIPAAVPEAIQNLIHTSRLVGNAAFNLGQSSDQRDSILAAVRELDSARQVVLSLLAACSEEKP